LARLYWRRRRLERASEALCARQAQLSEREALLTFATPQGALLLKQLDAVDRAIDRKTRLLLRLREAEERQKRRLAQEERRLARRSARHPLRAFAGPLDEAANCGPVAADEMSREDAERLELRKRTARIEKANRQAEALLESIKKDLETAERSQNVIENKGGGDSTSAALGSAPKDVARAFRP